MARFGMRIKKAAKGGSSSATVRDYQLIESTLVTEKASLIGSEKRGAVFKVNVDATKLEIKRAVERVFGVQVEAVRTCNVMGKAKRTAKSSGRRPNYKKAYVTLKPGQTIDLVEGV